MRLQKTSTHIGSKFCSGEVSMTKTVLLVCPHRAFASQVHHTRRRHVADASAYRDSVAQGIMHPVVQCAHDRPIT